MLDAPGDRAQTAFIKSHLDFGAGLFLIAIALIGYYGSLGLRFGSLNAVGPALMPRSVAVLVGVFGIGLLITSFLSSGPRLERWHLRGPFFVLGAVLVFALTIRGSTISVGDWKLVIPQLGLAIAGPLVVLISSLADRDTRPVEIVIYAIILTAVCIGLFRYALRLPIPIMPLGYGPF